MKMKLYLFLFLIGLIPLQLHSQEIRNLTFECLEDPSVGGKVFQHEVLENSINMSLKTYGPCDADFKVLPIELDSGRLVKFEITDKKGIYEEGKLKCGCFYLFKFKILNYQLSPNFRSWTISNKSVPKSVWNEWYWSTLD